MLKINNVTFKGQYKEALEQIQKGNTITIRNFRNGSWEATKQIGNFIAKVKEAGITCKIEGNSLRSTTISI